MQDNDSVSLAELLRRVSGHLDGLASEVHAIEHSVGDQLGSQSGTTAQNITQLQRLDFLRQSLEDLALLNHFVSECCEGDVPARTADRLRLESTRALLVHETVGPAEILGDTSVGEVDLFS